MTRLDLAWIWGGGLLMLTLLWRLWRPLLAVTVSPELAEVEGVPVRRVQLAFVLLMALLVAIMMKIVGLVLVTSLLIIPAAAARSLARSPEQMALLAVGAGALAVGGGLWSSLRWDAPAGPAIVVSAALLFVLSLGLEHLLGNRSR